MMKPRQQYKIVKKHSLELTKTLAISQVFSFQFINITSWRPFLRWRRRRLQCVNRFHPAIALSHAFPVLSLPFSLTHRSAHSRLSFHSRDNFPHPSYSGEETWRNVIVYTIWILQHFTCPGSSSALTLAAENSTKRDAVGFRVYNSGEFAGTGKRNEDPRSEINEQLARRKVTFSE